ncbi:MAG: hypothetical protein IPO08_18150 [Xanthomonadales bacterium]|nr:hypothetical protein [Xanthomonadales bacterium]
MKTFDAWRLLITPLAPVHLGTGESFEPTNYVIEDDILHAFDTGAVLASFGSKDRDSLLTLASGRPDKQMIESLQKFFHDRRQGLIAHANQQIPVLPGVTKLYASRVGKTANHEADGSKVVNKLEIERVATNPVTKLPVLFGSSIKGAIRTALLDGINRGRPTSDRTEESLKMQQRLFKFTADKFELDPMRLLQFADAPWVAEDGLPPSHVQFAVNRKKTPVVDENGQLRKSKAANLYQVMEFVSAWRYRALAGQLNVQSLAVLGEHGRHTGKVPDSTLRFSARDIAKACNAFYRPILRAEMRLLAERGYGDAEWIGTMEALLNAAQEGMERGDAFLLRVGRHSGAESVTLNGVRKINITKGKGQPAGGKPNHALTIWLAAKHQDQSSGLVPFGWLLIELQPMESASAEWPELRVMCESRQDEARAQAQQIRAARDAAEAMRRETESKREAERLQFVQRQEEERQALRAEAERLSRRESMTASQRAIDDFTSYMAKRFDALRGKPTRANGEEHTRARALAKAALEDSEWSADDRRCAAVAIAEWLPKVVSVDMKDERKRLKLAALQGVS